MGFCPQFDIIWELLTPVEHINLFCKIKGITDPFDIYKITEKKLK